MKRIVASVILLLVMSGSIQAQQGDVAAGQAKSAVCAGCHGADGNSPAAQFPSLAGQVTGYIAKQLAKFKSGERSDPIMIGMVAALSEDDMQNLDAYYNSLEAKVGSITEEQVADAEAGGKIYRGGFARYQIAACMSCHGPAGHGVPPNFPRLSGQHAAYTERQLLAFKDGTRQDSMMNPTAFALSKQQIKQLSLYISALD